MLSTLFVLISELSDWRDSRNPSTWKYQNRKKLEQLLRMSDFGIERYGTHPLENFNGFIREQSNSKDNPMSVQTICAKSQIAKNVSIDLEISTKKRNRANAGGLKASEFLGIAGCTNFDPATIADTMYAWCGVVNNLTILTGNIDDKALSDFFNYIIETNIISKLAFIQKIRLNDPSKASNSRINARNVSFGVSA